jgi:ATP-dependent Lon protease
LNREELDKKISEAFSDLVIDKALVRSLKIRDKRTIPSFVEEWLISRFQKSGKSNADIYQDVTAFMSKHLPAKTEKERIKHELQSGETVTILDRFNVRIDIAKDKKMLTIPCIDQWGAGRLMVRSEGRINVIEMVDFKPMQSGKVDLQALIKAREHFSTREWIALLLRTMGYEPSAYSKAQQDNLILRLLPLVQNNLNMMELAPKGTGKSFIFSNLSRYVWVNSGGALTQAQLFKNLNTKEIGLMGRYDLLVLDEGQSISFKGADDIHAKFKDYLESGHYSIGNDKITSECGLMILANIDLYHDGSPRRRDYIRHLPPMFHDSALIDRFHGIVAG